MGARKRWTDNGSVVACKAYIRSSEDSTHGNRKKKDKFAAEAYDPFKIIKSDTSECPFISVERTGEAILQLYKKV